MNVKDFQYISEIAKCGNISHAANHLYISQSALTKHLKQLENELGIPLFLRLGKKVIPTPAGEYYCLKADEILRLNHELENGIKNLKASYVRQLRVGITPGRIDFFMYRVLPLFYQAYPDMELYLDCGRKAELLKKLSYNELDFLFCSEAPFTVTHVCHPVNQKLRLLLAPADSPLTKDACSLPEYPLPFVPLSRWIREPFVMISETTSIGAYTKNLFLQRGVTPKLAMVVDNPHYAVTAVRAGIGISLVNFNPHTSADYACFSTDIDPYFTKECVYTAPGVPLSPPAQYLLQLLRET